MKKRGTKFYQSLADKYCIARESVESRQEDIGKRNADIEKAKSKFNSMSIGLQEDEDIKEWYDHYINGMNYMIGLLKYNLRESKEMMEKNGEVLVNEYGDNLDELYKSWKF